MLENRLSKAALAETEKLSCLHEKNHIPKH